MWREGGREEEERRVGGKDEEDLKMTTVQKGKGGKEGMVNSVNITQNCS